MTVAAKYMYRSTANFNIWAITAAQRRSSRRLAEKQEVPRTSKTELRPEYVNDQNVDLSERPIHPSNKQKSISEEDDQSEGSDESDSSFMSLCEDDRSRSQEKGSRITVSGSMPSFGPGNIIRQRVSTHGHVRPMEREEDIAALNIASDHIGRVHMAGPINKWLATRHHFEYRYRKDLEKFRKIKADDFALARQNGFLTRKLQGENPPQCALASWYDLDLAREAGRSVDEPVSKSNAAMILYMRMSQKHDEMQVGEYVDSSILAVERETEQQVEHQDPPV